MNKNYLAKTEAFIKPFLDKYGYTLLKSEFTNEEQNWYLRLYIDLTEKEAAKRAAALEEEGMVHEENEENPVPGIDINDCAKVSRYLSKWLDKEDFIKETYTLEVCSKGFLDNSNTDEI